MSEAEYDMKRLSKILRYEITFRFPIWEIIVIVALVLTINGIWGELPQWFYFALGVALGAAFLIMERWTSRSPSPKPPRSWTPT